MSKSFCFNNTKNILSVANQTSASFYSTHSFNRNPSTHITTLSTQINFYSTYKKKFKNKNKTYTNFHHKVLKEKLLKNEAYLLLEDSVKKNVFLTHNDIPLRKEDFIPRTSLTKRDAIICKNTIPTSSFVPICTEEYKLFNYGTPRSESVSQFLEKTNYLRRAKYINNLQKEKQKKINESSEVKLQAEEMQIYSFNSAKNLMNEFTNGFIGYIKYLNQEFENNKTILKDLIFQLSNLQKEIKEINHQISTLRLSINIGKTYKCFLLCVKYHVLHIEDLPRDIYNMYGLNEIKPKPPSRIQRRPTKRLSVRLFTRRSTRSNDTLSNIEEVKKQEPPKVVQPQPINLEIFSSVDEFFQSINALEASTIKNLEKYNNIQNEVRYEKDNIIKEKENDKKISDEEEEKKALQKLKELKRKNLLLKKELTDLEYNSKQRFHRKIFNKIIEILLNFPFNLETHFHCPNLYNVLNAKAPTILVKGLKQNTILYGLTIIEEVLLSHINQFHQMNSNMRTSMEIAKIKNSLDTRKRVLNSRMKIKEEKERRERMNENIIKKFNKLLYIPNRKVSMKVYNITDNNTENKKNKNMSKEKKNQNVNGIDMLTY